jgi:hypothetical protein
MASKIECASVDIRRLKAMAHSGVPTGTQYVPNMLFSYPLRIRMRHLGILRFKTRAFEGDNAPRSRPAEQHTIPTLPL